MTFNQELNNIQFVGLTNESSGNYTVQIVLEDSMGKMSKYDVSFEILP